jgi:hypothetical protein
MATYIIRVSYTKKKHPEQQFFLDISATVAFFYWFGHFHKLKEIIRNSSML